jgi:sulfite reductase alpha subunit-like flavoprotein
VLTLNELAAAPLPAGPWLLAIMTSTYTANPPSNATAFKALLERSGPGTPGWQDCRYLIWGLGNTQWNAFLAFPRWVHSRLAALGATPVADLGFGDVGSPAWERLHAEWNNAVWPVLLQLSGARRTESAAARIAAERAEFSSLTRGGSGVAMRRSLVGSLPSGLAGRSSSVSSVMRRIASGSRPGGSRPGISRPGGGPPASQPRDLLVPVLLSNAVDITTVPARVLASRELQAPGSPKRTRHLEVSLPAGASYRAGGHIGVCPQNDPEQVEWLARRLGAAPDAIFVVPATMNVRAVPRGVVLQVRNVLTSLVDLAGRPTVDFLELLLEKVSNPAEWSRLAELRDVLQWPDGPRSALHDTVDAGGWDVLRLLADFPSCTLNIFDFLRAAQPLRPRYYSVSSSPRVHGEQVAHLTVGLECTPVAGRPGREFRGMGSHYLHTLREGDRLNVFFDDAAGFRLQEEVTKPMIFISAGTGFAPMRAFLWERQALREAGATLGEAALFHGLRSRQADYLYASEIGQFAATGLLDHVHLAVSREQPGRREYVQDRIRAQSALVGRLLAAGGYVYVCGSQPMRDAVRAALAGVLAEHQRVPREHAGAALSELESSGRYRPDLWG